MAWAVKSAGWAIAALAAGAAGSALAVEAARRFEEEPEPTGRFRREEAAVDRQEQAGTTA